MLGLDSGGNPAQFYSSKAYTLSLERRLFRLNCLRDNAEFQDDANLIQASIVEVNELLQWLKAQMIGEDDLFIL